MKAHSAQKISLLALKAAFLSFALLFSTPIPTYAQSACGNLFDVSTTLTDVSFEQGLLTEFSVTASNLQPNQDVRLVHYTTPGNNWIFNRPGQTVTNIASYQADAAGNLSFTLTNAEFPDLFNRFGYGPDTYYHHLGFRASNISGNIWGDFCHFESYTITHDLSCSSINVFTLQETEVDGETVEQKCYECIEKNAPFYVEATGLRDGGIPYQGNAIVNFMGGWNPFDGVAASVNAEGNFVSAVLMPTLDRDVVTIGIKKTNTAINNFCTREFNLRTNCQNACITDPVEEQESTPFKLCGQIPAGTPMFQACVDCAEGEDGEEGVWTAVGCIKKQPETIVRSLITIGLMMAGGVALLMILAAGFFLTTSQGEPKKVSDAKEMITAAVTGLLFVIFSVVILEFIGFTVLKIPGFGG